MIALVSPSERQAANSWAGSLGKALKLIGILVALLVVVQSLIVVQARPQDLITGIHGDRKSVV